jgi:rhodanese-related sulfurtransferase
MKHRLGRVSVEGDTVLARHGPDFSYWLDGVDLVRGRKMICCRGSHGVLSYEAVAALRARGFKARRLEDGLPEWRVAGLPVVTNGA